MPDIVDILIRAEMDSARTPDCRRLMRDERMAIMASRQQMPPAPKLGNRSGPCPCGCGETLSPGILYALARTRHDAARKAVDARVAEAYRVARMWGVIDPT